MTEEEIRAELRAVKTTGEISEEWVDLFCRSFAEMAVADWGGSPAEAAAALRRLLDTGRAAIVYDEAGDRIGVRLTEEGEAEVRARWGSTQH
jgi:hypothetical protein